MVPAYEDVLPGDNAGTGTLAVAAPSSCTEEFAILFIQLMGDNAGQLL